MLRYATLLYVQIRASLLLALQYRWDFLIDGAISVLWAITALVPLKRICNATRATVTVCETVWPR